MMNIRLAYFLLFCMLAGCRERYESPVHSVTTGYLVLEGVVNPGPGTTSLILSRSTNLDSITKVYETGANVVLEAADQTVLQLTEQSTGHYEASNLPLIASQQYRIHIFTKTGAEYLSEYVPVLTNPPIDSISWKRENGDVQLYVNTHDPQNNTRYYQWQTAETWEFRMPYYTYLKYQVEQSQGVQLYSVVFRDSTRFGFDSTIHKCWQFKNSTDIILGSSAKLSQDIIQLPIAKIQKDSWELSVLYSIDIKQYSWTKAGYEFLGIMKKNTEATGSVFDAQPSQLNGNIHCVSNPTETVIGFFNISSVQEKRIFIYNSEVPDWNYNPGCYTTTIVNQSDSIKRYGIGLIPTEVGLQAPSGAIVSFYAARPTCVDCTISGINNKPSYWP